MNKNILSIGLAIVLILSACVGCGRGKEGALEESIKQGEESEESVKDLQDGGPILYYTNKECTILYPLEKKIEFPQKSSLSRTERIIKSLIDSKHEIREDRDWESIIPEGIISRVDYRPSVEISSWERRESEIVISMNEEYDALSQNRKVVMHVGIARTLLALNLAEVVSFVRNEEIVYQVKASQEFAINQYGEEFFSGTVEVTLYFANREGTALRKERRKLFLGITDPLSKAVVNALIGGPLEAESMATIPAGTVLKDIFVKDSVCYVDLSAEFQRNYLGGETMEVLTVYSIVNSLCGISGINKVQILIDGKRSEIYKFSVPLNNFLDRDLTLVE